MRLASIAAATLLAGLLSGPGSSADEGHDGVTIPFDCALPTGTKPVSVVVTTALQAAGSVGQPISAGTVKVDVGLPQAELEGLVPAGTTTLASTAALAVKVTQNGQSADAQWANLEAPGTPLPADGTLHLVHEGEVPTVTVNAPGDVVLTAGALTMNLLPTADGGQEDAAKPLSVTCRPGADQSGKLATIQVAGDAGADPTKSPGSGQAGDGGEKNRDGIAVEPQDDPVDPPRSCPADLPLPEGELDTSHAPQAAMPPGADEPKVSAAPNGGSLGCAYAVGYANVTKLNGAMIINDPSKKPAMMSVAAVKQTSQRSRPPFAKGGYYQRIDSLGKLVLPDAESTFLTFGFEPVTAKVHFENGPVTISTGTVGFKPDPVEKFATAFFTQTLRVYDVKVNGVPLDVGPNCRSSKPFPVVLSGLFPKYANVFLGGPMEGTVDIPGFSGCGTGGEDLDPLFTASLSGPGNLISVVQGNTCVPTEPSTECPGRLPELPHN
ncbi:DUF6801 domain-containing protein [Streptomyces sp. NBC_01465]|uniref:DUF6801 domain-containing protein n=1 Tax=Streptomyces sp. NBC_01465 TaxID=2903878 RepID=UPI002E374281|nr:DUF6801 domain-containing protein [Streptomyces sp. NBC_01465]